MKKQQVISRFFTSKTTDSSTAVQNDASSSRGRNAVAPVPQKSPATLEWPPRSFSKRKNVEHEISPQQKAKRRPIGESGTRASRFSASSKFGGSGESSDAQGSPISSKDGAVGIDSFERKVLEIPDKVEDEEEERSGGKPGRVLGAEPGVVDGVDDEKPNSKLLSESGVSAESHCSDLGGTYESAPGSKRRKVGSVVNEIRSQEIPASHPVKHRRFVETLLARSDSNGDVRESWYGNPPTGKEKYTPLETQVAELKAKYPDVVLMVEVGYKYRFFGNDAETAARILGIFAHYNHNFLTASIPTFRLHVHVRRLVGAGCKVGVVRQTETAAIKAHGANKAGPFTRGLSALYTRATLEAAEDLGGEAEGRLSGYGSYIMCVAERPLLAGKGISKDKLKSDVIHTIDSESQRGSYDTELGVVAVEAATGDVMFSHFKDSVMRTQLEGRLLSCSPVELLLATPLSPQTEKLLMDFAGPSSEVRVERISRDDLKDGGALSEVMDFYKAKEGAEDSASSASEEDRIDEGLEAVVSMPNIVVQALCLALRYLKQFGLEKVLRLGATFRPFFCQTEMNLSPNALRQLEILKNNADGTEKGSLLWLLDQTQTAFGARLLHHWVTHPLCDHDQIALRLDAVTEIADSIGSAAQITGPYSGGGKAVVERAGGKHLIGGILDIVGRMPDLERGITRIFHRTATAAQFVSVIQALVTCAKHMERVPGRDCIGHTTTEDENGEECSRGIRSPLLQRLTAAVSSRAICEHANRLLSALNTDAAAAGDKLSLFNCKDNRFPEVLACRAAIKVVEKELDGFLPAFRKLLRLPNLQYMSVNGSTHLVEAPVAQRVPGDWIKVNSTKKTHRYHPPEVLKAVDKLALATEQLAAASARAWDMFLEDFSSHYIEFRASVQALAALDCLHSLAVVSRNQGYTRPEFVGQAEPSQLVIMDGRHPILDSTLQERFVPNDTILHAQNERCQIITGPNMGGKSCYIRQVALIAIMAQVGSYVPASSARLHLFDSVHTRMGASDSLQKGSSTFLEELSEASTILKSASSRSLVIMDELGRGTSTHDGVALAYATLHYLLKETQCLTLFVTHYPKIADLRDEFPGVVSPYYVSYLAQEAAPTLRSELTLGAASEGAHDSNMKVAVQDITFLYKLVSGVASKSFGLYVARLAQIPESCIITAASMASKLEMLVTDRESTRDTAMSTKEAVREKLMTGIETIPHEQCEELRAGDGELEPTLSRNGISDSDQRGPSANEFVQSTTGREGSGQSSMGEGEMRAVEDILQKLNRSLGSSGDAEASVTYFKAVQRHLTKVLSVKLS